MVLKTEGLHHVDFAKKGALAHYVKGEGAKRTTERRFYCEGSAEYAQLREVTGLEALAGESAVRMEARERERSARPSYLW